MSEQRYPPQMIPSGMWTRLRDTDVEIHHTEGRVVAVASRRVQPPETPATAAGEAVPYVGGDQLRWVRRETVTTYIPDDDGPR